MVAASMTTSHLETLAEELRVYDIDQQGWEHEGAGFSINARHVLTHLNKTLTSKNFYNRAAVIDEIAPDNLQYALRLARWQDVDLAVIRASAESTAGITETIEAQRQLHTFEPLPKVAFLGATSIIGAYAHDVDHASSKAATETEANRKKTAFMAASLLLHSVELQVREFSFDPMQSFRARLTGLRRRFNIPEPE